MSIYREKPILEEAKKDKPYKCQICGEVHEGKDMARVYMTTKKQAYAICKKHIAVNDYNSGRKVAFLGNGELKSKSVTGAYEVQVKLPSRANSALRAEIALRCKGGYFTKATKGSAYTYTSPVAHTKNGTTAWMKALYGLGLKPELIEKH